MVTKDVWMVYGGVQQIRMKNVCGESRVASEEELEDDAERGR
jgi:hypothetical protein